MQFTTSTPAKAAFVVPKTAASSTATKYISIQAAAAAAASSAATAASPGGGSKPQPISVLSIQQPSQAQQQVTGATAVAAATAGGTKYVLQQGPAQPQQPQAQPQPQKQPLTISINEVFACAQPLPLQDEARASTNKGKMTTIADLKVQVKQAFFHRFSLNSRRTKLKIFFLNSRIF